MGGVLWSAALAVVGVLVWWRVRRRADRRVALSRLCERAGLEFAPIDPFRDTTWVAHARFGHADQWAENVVWDANADDGLRVLDLHWIEEVGEDGDELRRAATCAAIPVPFSCPRLTVEPRGIDDPFEAPGDEVRLELEEFGRRFRVRSADRRFAFAFLDQRMMRALLALPPEVLLDADEETVVLWAPVLPPERVLLLFEAARAIRRHIPRVVGDLYPRRPIVGPHERRWLQGRWSPEPTGDPA